MGVREDIHFCLACLAVLAERLPADQARKVCDLMLELLEINREVRDE